MRKRQPRRLSLPLALVGGLVVASALILGVSVSDSSAASAEAFGVYSCCGWDTCTVLAATSACPQGDTQCSHVTDSQGRKAKCCVNYCNAPDPAMPAPHWF